MRTRFITGSSLSPPTPMARLRARTLARARSTESRTKSSKASNPAIFSRRFPNPAPSRMSSGNSTPHSSVLAITPSISSRFSATFFSKNPRLSSTSSRPSLKSSSKTSVASATPSSVLHRMRSQLHSSSNIMSTSIRIAGSWI